MSSHTSPVAAEWIRRVTERYHPSLVLRTREANGASGELLDVNNSFKIWRLRGCRVSETYTSSRGVAAVEYLSPNVSWVAHEDDSSDLVSCSSGNESSVIRGEA